MDPTEGLQQLGLNEWEARAYLALLSASGISGYEVARQSGVPRAKIYGVLESLVAKGAVLAAAEEGRTLYHPVPHQMLLRRHRQAAEQLETALGSLLAELAQPDRQAPLLTVRGREELIARAGAICGNARVRLFVSGWPTDLAGLAPALQAAEQRGVLVFALVYGDANLGLARQFYHSPPSGEGRPGGLVPGLVVAADHSEVLLAEMAPDNRATGLWTRNRGIALMAAEYVRHDIMLAETSRRAGPALNQQLNDLTADLQVMWFDSLLPGKER